MRTLVSYGQPCLTIVCKHLVANTNSIVGTKQSKPNLAYRLPRNNRADDSTIQSATNEDLANTV